MCTTIANNRGSRVEVNTAPFHARVWGSFHGLAGLKEKNVSFHPLVKLSIVGSLCDREVACSALDLQGSNFESCVWRPISPIGPGNSPGPI